MADKIATWRYVADLGVSVLGEDPNRCPTYSELAALPGVAVSGTYAPNRLVKEADVKKGFVVKRVFTIYAQGTSGGYTVSRDGYITSGLAEQFFADNGKIVIPEGQALSGDSPPEFNRPLYVVNMSAGNKPTALIPADSVTRNGSYAISI